MKNISFKSWMFSLAMILLFQEGFWLSEAIAEPQPQFVWMVPPLGPGYFNYPTGICLDNINSFVYVTDTDNHRIQKFNTEGELLAIWGTCGQGIGQFNFPCSPVIDDNGNIYIADTNNHRIQKFSLEGDFISVWGGYGQGAGQFNFPRGLTIDGSGHLYVADTENHRVQKLSSQGVPLSAWGSYGQAGGQFYHPATIDLDSKGDIYVTDSGNHRIQKISSRGDFLSVWGSFGTGNGSFDNPVGIFLDVVDNVYITDCGNNRILKFTPEGIFLSAFGEMGKGSGQFIYPRGIAVNDTAGLIFVADTDNDSIQKFDSDFNFIDRWGTFGQGNGQFDYPRGITITRSSDILIADSGNHRIQKFAPDGTLLMTFGSYGSGTGQLNRPYGIDEDVAGHIYVADTYNNRIQKFNAYGQFLSSWGGFGSGEGEFIRPYDVAVDNSGNIYVADMDNHRIQKFTYNILALRLDDGLLESECVPLGGSITYTIEYDNTLNTLGAQEVTIIDKLPLETTFVLASHIGTYNPNDHTVTWNLGTLPPGSGRDWLYLEVLVQHTVSPDIILTNSVTVKGDSLFPTTAEEKSRVCPNQAPLANAGPDMIVDMNRQGGAYICLDGSRSYDPDGQPLTYRWTWKGGSAGGVQPCAVFPLGKTIVTLTVDDGWSTAFDIMEIMVVDNIPPVISCPPALTAEGTKPEGTPLALSIPSYYDLYNTTPTLTNNAHLLFPLGTTIVTWIARDSSGNTASCIQTVTLVDTTPPNISWPPNILLEEADAEGTGINLGRPIVSDNADPAPLVTHTNPSVFPLGKTEVVWTATDFSGNSSSCIQLVIVTTDTTGPKLICPPDIIVEQTNPEGMVISLGRPQVSDTCDPYPSVTNDAPQIFSLGTTKSCNQLITIADTIAPQITNLQASPQTIWISFLDTLTGKESPCNGSGCGKMAEVVVLTSAKDACDETPECKIIEVTSNQPCSCSSPDWRIINESTAFLRAEADCCPSSDNRTYTITVECTDVSNNRSTASTQVQVKRIWEMIKIWEKPWTRLLTKFKRYQSQYETSQNPVTAITPRGNLANYKAPLVIAQPPSPQPSSQSNNTSPPPDTSNDISPPDTANDTNSNPKSQDCTVCHYEYSSSASHATHLGLNLKGVTLGCSDCHEQSKSEGNPCSGLLADGKPIEQTAVCDGCHSPDGAFDGVNDQVIGARHNWKGGVYQPLPAQDLKEGLENWCAGCHDNGSSVCNGSHRIAAPNVMGDNVTYGYAVSGHKITCCACHKTNARHIDGVARTYTHTSDPWNNDDSCNYQNSYRLKYQMIVPLANGPLGGYAKDRFALCFTCHDYDMVMGSSRPYQTNFQDGGKNRHLSHLSSGRVAWDSDWDYLNNPDEEKVLDSRLSCTACHNVHGSSNPAMIHHGELISTPGTKDKVPALDFRWYKEDGYTPTLFGPESLFADMALLGGPGGGDIQNSKVCVGCHGGPGSIKYSRLYQNLNKPKGNWPTVSIPPSLRCLYPQNDSMETPVDTHVTFLLLSNEKDALDWTTLSISLTGTLSYRETYNYGDKAITILPYPDRLYCYQVMVTPKNAFEAKETISVIPGITDTGGHTLTTPEWHFTTGEILPVIWRRPLSVCEASNFSSPELLIDGYLQTGNDDSSFSSHWAVYDLGQSYTIDRVRLLFSPQNSRLWNIYVSDDAKSFGSAAVAGWLATPESLTAKVSLAGNAIWDSIAFPAQQGRYLKIETGRGPLASDTIYEIQFAD